MNLKRPDVPIPKCMRSLPVTSKGYLKPWFVKADDFRVVDGKKAWLAIQRKACWICGNPFKENRFALVASPVSAIALVTREPPCHVECAEYAMQVCPFILYPKSRRRTANLDIQDTMEHINESLDVKYAPDNPERYYLLIVNDFDYDEDSKAIRCLEKNILQRQYWIGGVKQPDYPRPILEFHELPQSLQSQLSERTSWPFSDAVPVPPSEK